MIGIVQSLTARVLRPRKEAPKAFVIHTTGSTDRDAILRWYRSPDDEARQPHFFIEASGRIHQIAPLDRAALHAGRPFAETSIYKTGDYAFWSCWVWSKLHDEPIARVDEYPGYRAWRTTWQSKGIETPLQLVTGELPNDRSIGIELQAHEKPLQDVFTDSQYESLVWLLEDTRGAAYTLFGEDIPLTREHVLGHYDISPMRRSNLHGSTDPGRQFKFDRVFDLLRTNKLKRGP